MAGNGKIQGGSPRCIGRTNGGLNSKLHAVCDGEGRPLVLLLTEGQASDHTGDRIVLGSLPKASCLITDRGYDSNWFRKALAERGTTACIPPTKNRKLPIPYDEMLYRQRHRIENMFARPNDWRRTATGYDRYAHTFFSASSRRSASLLP